MDARRSLLHQDCICYCGIDERLTRLTLVIVEGVLTVQSYLCYNFKQYFVADLESIRGVPLDAWALDGSE